MSSGGGQRDNAVAVHQIGSAVGTIALSSIPYVGWLAAAGYAYLDATVLTPKLQRWANKGRNKAQTDRLLDVPTGTNEAGGPRIYALGGRVRVPTHVLWQDKKVREQGIGGSRKGGTGVNLRRTYFDCMIAVNDRYTYGLSQLIGNGALLLFQTRNLVDVVTSDMLVTETGGFLYLTMASPYSTNFNEKFRTGDVVKLSGFVVSSGNNINDNYWKVVTALPTSGSFLSELKLSPYWGQTTAGIVATAGTPWSPATVTRIDDVMFARTGTATSFSPNGPALIDFQSDSHLTADLCWKILGSGAISSITITGITNSSVLAICAPNGIANRQASTIGSNIVRVSVGYTGADAIVGPTDLAPGGPPVTISMTNPTFAGSLFPPTFVPADAFYHGTEDAIENPYLITVKGTGNVPTYRGTAYQALDDFYVSDFGDQLPWALEALIQPDFQLSWPQALAEILQRGDVPASVIDTTGVPNKPFLGAYLRGPAPTDTQLQPFLLAGHIIGQERKGEIALFTVDTADIVDVRNTAGVSDLGCGPEGSASVDQDYTYEDEQDASLPTFVGVRHQDPDNGYADGYQSFGLRTPATAENGMDLDLTNVVLTRKQARELAQTVLRRAHINRRRYTVALPPNYCDLLENDLIRFTDRQGQTVVARIIQRDIGADFAVRVTCIAEMIGAGVAGGGVEPGPGQPPTVPTMGAVTAVAIDCPALTTAESQVPAVKIAACTFPGANWGGCSLWESIDGTTWTNRGTVPTQAGIGSIVTAAMAAGTAAESYGSTLVTTSVTAVDVEFLSEGPFGIEDATLVEASAGKNWCAIIDPTGAVEIAAFRDATFVSGTTWTLTNWLRGLRGTSPSAHVVGCRVVLLSPVYGSGVEHLEYAGLIQPQAIAYKLVPAGQTLDTTQPIQIVAGWRNACPLPVRSVTKAIGASPFDARFTVAAHWCKQVLPLGTQPPHPMDDPPEGYRLTIYDPTGASARRIKTIAAAVTTGATRLRDRWFNYPASEQTADGYTPAAAETFWIDVQQIGPFGLSPSIKQEL
ncbi:MAG: phage tail protein [Planctomycetota bacterium]